MRAMDPRETILVSEAPGNLDLAVADRNVHAWADGNDRAPIVKGAIPVGMFQGAGIPIGLRGNIEVTNIVENIPVVKKNA